MNYFSKNIKFLRLKLNYTQIELSASIGFKQSAWSGYESGASTPNFKDLLKIIEYFDITASELLETDLGNVEVISKTKVRKNLQKVEVNNEANVEVNAKKGHISPDLHITMSAEPDAGYLAKSAVIPITDISVAAGSGVFNSDFVENVDSLRLPGPLIKRGATYLCVKIKGPSMSPTLQDAGYVIIRHLDRSEWAKMPDERIFVVSDNDGKSYLKRVKNRFKQGFIVLKSDNPDQASFPNFNLTATEINSIWYVEWYLSAKMPNIHDQYYSRLQRLEDIVDNLVRKVK